MLAKILQVEFPIGVLKLGDTVLFQEETDFNNKGMSDIPNKIISKWKGVIESFEIGTNVMQGTHEIMVFCKSITYISASHPAFKGRETMSKMINNPKNIISLC